MTTHDVLVIGGGPAGATAATLLAMDGRDVVLLERDTFPRYHVGESLLPATVHGICRLLGVSDALHGMGFVRKRGGTFRWGSNPAPWTFAFGDQTAMAGADHAYQVERADFDTLLLRNAAARGVDVREGWNVTAAIDGPRIEGVHARAPDGSTHRLHARYVVDASGGKGVLASVVGERHYDAFFKNVAIFGYFHKAGRLPAPNDGNILTAAFDEGWVWFIPLRDGLTSVGAVLRQAHANQLRQQDRREALRSLVARCPMVDELLGGASAATEAPYDEVRIVRDFSYTNDRFYDRGGVLIGDAACFIDPVFSSGVHLATLSGLLAARSINSCLAGQHTEAEAFDEFTARYRREYAVFYQFLLGFYEIHRDEASHFWNARKLVGSHGDAREAFVRLVSGLSTAEASFADVDAFTQATQHGSNLLEAASQVSENWSRQAPALAAQAADHIGVLHKERRALLSQEDAPVLQDGLQPTPNGLRWAPRP